MKSIGIRQFRDRLAWHLREVEKGVTLLLTSRGKPVAVMRRITTEDLRQADPEASLATLAAEGKVRRGSGKVSMRRPLAARPGIPISRVVSENRR